GYAPADAPEIAFAVLLANEPAWRIKAHYAGRRLVQIYLERRTEIARQRDARLQPNALVLPERDASGALLTASANGSGAATETAAATPEPEPAPEKPATPRAAPLPLPPVPGALPPPPAPTPTPDGDGGPSGA